MGPGLRGMAASSFLAHVVMQESILLILSSPSLPHSPRCCRDLQTQRRWSRLVEQMKYSSPVGILHVDSKRMRAELVESVRSTTEDMKATLLACASAQCGAVLERGRRWVSELQARPPGLDDYAGLCVRLSHMVRDKGELLSAGEGVDALYDLFKENGGRIDIKDQVRGARKGWAQG